MYRKVLLLGMACACLSCAPQNPYEPLFSKGPEAIAFDINDAYLKLPHGGGISCEVDDPILAKRAIVAFGEAYRHVDPEFQRAGLNRLYIRFKGHPAFTFLTSFGDPVKELPKDALGVIKEIIAKGKFSDAIVESEDPKERAKLFQP